MVDAKSERRYILTLLLFFVYLLALIWLILFKLQFSIPYMKEGRVINIIPLMGSFDISGVFHFSEIRINIIAFIPLGIYVNMLKAPRSFVKKLLAIVGLTFTFEIIQFLFVIGRADITDVLSNTLGGVIGIGIYALVSMALRRRTNKVINMVAFAFTVCTLLLITFLLINHRWVIIR